MHIRYDEEVDILVVSLAPLKEGKGATELAPGVWIDVTDDGKVLGLEIMDASKRYPIEKLREHPADYERPIPLAEVAPMLGVTPQALQKAIVRGRLRGKKIGNGWFTTIAAVTEYTNSRAHEGPGSASGEAQATGVPFLTVSSKGELGKAIIDFSQAGEVATDGTIVPGTVGEGTPAIKPRNHRLKSGPLPEPDMTIEMVDGKPVPRPLDGKTKRRKA